MSRPRSKSISTKVTEAEYAQFEALAGDQTISEWTRDALLKAARPTPAEQTIVAELLALRTILGISCLVLPVGSSSQART